VQRKNALARGGRGRRTVKKDMGEERVINSFKGSWFGILGEDVRQKRRGKEHRT